MNGSGDIPLTQNTIPDSKPCGLTFVIPTLGMSSCRGRAEAFARSLQSKLRTLGSQNDGEHGSQENEFIINGESSSSWMPTQDPQSTVTEIQPTRRESDSFFDFDCELESPGSPVDECEYSRLIETTSNTPHNSTTESGYVCASFASSHSSSSDEPFFDPDSSEHESHDYEKHSRLFSVITPDSSHELRQCIEVSQLNITQEDAIASGHTSEIFSENLSLFSKHLSNEPSTSKVLMVEDLSLQLQNDLLKELKTQSDNYNTERFEKPAEEPQHEITVNSEIPKNKNVINSENEVYTFHRINGLDNSFSDSDEKIESSFKTEQLIAAVPIEKIDIQKILPEKETNLDSDDENECRPQRVRRCSSLKTGKTPPGTPGRKKIVRFADVLGLDLADVKTFLDEIPTIPKSAFEDLEVLDTEPPIQLAPRSEKLLMPLFQQPAGLPNFLDVVREKQVSLENAAVTDHINQTITGTVRVRNLDFHKSVHIRYTMDNWRSFADLQANYVNNSCDGFSDKFAFILFANSLNIDERLEFAVRFHCKGQQFWDNNYGANYCFQCLPSSTINTQNTINSPISFASLYQSNNNNTSLSPSVESWSNSFY